MPYQRAVLTPDGVVPSAEAPAPVSLTVTVYAGAYSQRVLKATTDGLAEFLTAYHMLRTAPPSSPPPGAPGYKGRGVPPLDPTAVGHGGSNDDLTAAGIALDAVSEAGFGRPAPPATGMDMVDGPVNGAGGGEGGEGEGEEQEDTERLAKLLGGAGGDKAAQMAALMRAMSSAGSASGVKLGWADAIGAGAGPGAGPTGPVPVVHDSWRHDMVEGVRVMGLEYSTAHSDVKGGSKVARDGARFHLSFVLNSVEDVVYEVELRAPRAEWGRLWNSVGGIMVDQLYLNWTDDSPARFQ